MFKCGIIFYALFNLYFIAVESATLNRIVRLNNTNYINYIYKEDNNNENKISKNSMTTNEFNRFRNQFNKINLINENINCKLNQIEEIDSKTYLTSTLLVATAIEKLKFYSSNQKVGKLYSYSVLFQIMKIYKYENHLIQDINEQLLRNKNKFNTNLKDNEYYEFISSQDMKLEKINLNSFILIENFTSPDSNKLRDSCNQIDVKLNQSYLLYIDKQDSSVKMNQRKYFTHPIRTKRNMSSTNSINTIPVVINATTNQVNKNLLKSNTSVKISFIGSIENFLHNELKKWNILNLIFPRNSINLNSDKSGQLKLATPTSTQSAKLSTFQNKRLVEFVRIPIFKLVNEPIIFNIDNKSLQSQLIERNITNGLCNFCLRPNISKPNIRFKLKNLQAKLGANATFECSFQSGYQPKPIRIFWFKYYNQIKMSNTKFTIETNNQQQFSRLTINSVQLNDNGYYYCLMGDYLTKPLPDILIDKARLVVTKSTNDKILKYKNNKTSTLTSTPVIYQNMTSVAEKPYVKCEKYENTCENGGTCYKKNRKYYIKYIVNNSDFEDLAKIKICICKDYYEGPNCEIELMRTIIYDKDEIPNDLIALWNRLGGNKT